MHESSLLQPGSQEAGRRWVSCIGPFIKAQHPFMKDKIPPKVASLAFARPRKPCLVSEIFEWTKLVAYLSCFCALGSTAIYAGRL